MGSPAGTTVVIVGDDSGAAVRALTGFQNVQAASLAGRTDEEIARWTSTAQTPYLVHDRDPLEHVAGAWTEFFDDQATLGTLRLEIDRTVDALDRGALSIPDYYIVIDPESLPTTLRHWWLGVVSSAAPVRVIPWRGADAPIAPFLRRLPTSRPWPEHGTWLRSVTSAIPDRVGIDRASADPGTAA